MAAWLLYGALKSLTEATGGGSYCIYIYSYYASGL